jgi:hypothetical protein
VRVYVPGVDDVVWVLLDAYPVGLSAAQVSERSGVPARPVLAVLAALGWALSWRDLRGVRRWALRDRRAPGGWGPWRGLRRPPGGRATRSRGA